MARLRLPGRVANYSDVMSTYEQGVRMGAIRRYKIPLTVLVLAAMASLATIARSCFAAGVESESQRLASVLELGSGMTVAEIGAGDGEMALKIAGVVGPAGKVYATEIGKSKTARIRSAAASAKLENVEVLEAGETSTNLPSECCDAIFMRRVYHHFSQPAEMSRSLMESLRPGGRMAVIDFPSGAETRWYGEVDGVPESRGGHGMPPDLLVKELAAAGSVLEQRIDDWAGRMYCVVVSKPPSADSIQ